MQPEIILHLSLISHIGPATIQLLVHQLPAQFNLSDLYQFTALDFTYHYRLSAKTIGILINGLADKALIENELSLIEKNNIQWVTYYDAGYPALLKHIVGAPVVLYYQGTSLVAPKSIAIIGSREADHYAKAVIQDMVPLLVERGYTIISGGARGADTMAHQAALHAKGKTIAILGSGLLKPYPSQNKKLFEQIVLNGGSLVSSFALTTSALPGNFPARNRIIAGMSQGCVVVQAAVQSGARITANYALEQGREVFAVPGAITNRLSAGCHDLIKHGAHLVTNGMDVLKELGDFVSMEPINQINQTSPLNSTMLGGLSFLASVILNTCVRSCSLEELLEITQVPMTEVMACLFDLQLQGKIAQDGAGLWQNNG